MKMAANNTQSSEAIRVILFGMDGVKRNFHVKMNEELNKIMHAYSYEKGFLTSKIMFQYKGKLIKETDTPDLLGMKDGDTIHVFRHDPWSKPKKVL